MIYSIITIPEINKFLFFFLTGCFLKSVKNPQGFIAKSRCRHWQIFNFLFFLDFFSCSFRHRFFEIFHDFYLLLAPFWAPLGIICRVKKSIENFFTKSVAWSASVDQTFSMSRQVRPRRRNTKALPQPADRKIDAIQERFLDRFWWSQTHMQLIDMLMMATRVISDNESVCEIRTEQAKPKKNNSILYSILYKDRFDQDDETLKPCLHGQKIKYGRAPSDPFCNFFSDRCI